MTLKSRLRVTHSLRLLPFQSLGTVFVFAFCTNYDRIQCIYGRTWWHPASIINSVTLKTRLWVVQGHWKWRRSIDHYTTFYWSAIKLNTDPVLSVSNETGVPNVNTVPNVPKMTSHCAKKQINWCTNKNFRSAPTSIPNVKCTEVHQNSIGMMPTINNDTFNWQRSFNGSLNKTIL